MAHPSTNDGDDAMPLVLHHGHFVETGSRPGHLGRYAGGLRWSTAFSEYLATSE